MKSVTNILTLHLNKLSDRVTNSPSRVLHSPDRRDPPSPHTNRLPLERHLQQVLSAAFSKCHGLPLRTLSQSLSLEKTKAIRSLASTRNARTEPPPSLGFQRFVNMDINTFLLYGFCDSNWPTSMYFFGGKRKGFGRVACINATVSMSVLSSFSVSVDELCSTCKFTDNGEDRVVVGSLDLNQCVSLPDEIAGTRPKEIGADFARAYLSNECVAKELHRNGLAHALVAKSKLVAHDWGISDLYVHVAIDNEPAKKLYTKSGFIFESDEPAWQARFLDRPKRLLLWHDIPSVQL